MGETIRLQNGDHHDRTSGDPRWCGTTDCPEKWTPHEVCPKCYNPTNEHPPWHVSEGS